MRCHFVALDLEEYKGRAWSAVYSAVRACKRAWIDEVTAVVLHYLGLVSVPAHKHITVKLPLNSGETFNVSPRNDLVAVCDTDFEIANLHNSYFG